jgi:DNA-binding transcriptional ArsR family regulator
VHAFDILGDPVRRRILELLADGEQTSGAITDVIRAEFGLSSPLSHSICECCVTAGSRLCGLRALAGSTPSSPRR